MSEIPRTVFTAKVWRDPLTGKVYKASAPGVFEAQVITPEDIEAIEAVTVLDEVLGLARQVGDPA